MRNAQIQTVEAASRALSTILTAPARIAFSQTGVARVAPRVPGMLDQISNVRGRDLKGFIDDAQATIAREVRLPSG